MSENFPPQQPQTPPAQTGPPPNPYAQPVLPPMNVLSLVSFIGSFFIALVGIVCGHIALSQIKKTGERGRGFALAGTIIGYVVLIFEVLTVIFALAIAGLGLSLATAIGGMSGSSTASPRASGHSLTDGPENMGSGGVVFLSDDRVLETPALGADEDPVAPDTAETPGTVPVTLYVDYMCPACGSFEQQYGEELTSLVDSGEISLQIYPLTFLDRSSLGTNYSTRAANLLGCVAELDSDAALDTHNALFDPSTQPQEGTKGLTDDQLYDLAKREGGEDTSDLRSCVDEQWFASFFGHTTDFAFDEGILGLADGQQAAVSSTPTAVVAGQIWDYGEYPDFMDFLDAHRTDHE